MLYHHGCPHHHGIGLLTAKGRAWLDSLGLPSTAREQVTVALEMIDMLDVQLAPLIRSCAPTHAASLGVGG